MDINSRLIQFKTSNRFPHSLLIIGGENRTETAIFAAKLHLCENGDACGKCNTCSKIERKVYPDLILAKESSPDEKYSVKYMREITANSFIKPNDGDIRVYIFEDLDKMSEQCQNTLLKFIEEPLPFNKFIFTASVKSGILQTVLSRVVALGIEENSLASQDNITEIVNEILKAMISKNEYALAVGFSRLSKREAISAAFPVLIDFMREAAAHANGLTAKNKLSAELCRNISLKRILGVIDKLSEFLCRLDFNPNVQLAATFYASEIFEAIAN